MFNPARLKVQLKLAINRLKMLQAKKTSLNQQLRREIGTLIEKGKIESARVRIEHVIRDDFVIEAMENLELYCDLLLARFGLLETYKTCEASIEEAVHTVIWAAPRLSEVKELSLVRDQLASKFGKEFMIDAMENKNDKVNEKIIIKLQASAPDPYLVERYLEEIAKIYDIKWRSDLIDHYEEEVDMDNTLDDDNSDHGDGGGGQGELLAPLQEDQIDLPEIPTNSPIKKTVKPAENDPNDFDSLAKSLNDEVLTTPLNPETDDVEMKETAEETVEVERTADYKATSIALIEKLLQFSSPRLDAKIVNVLFLEGMMDICMTHITRLDLTKELIDLSKCTLEDKLRHATHERDMKDIEALKRSYHAMELLSGTTANHLWVQNSKFYTIVNHLFNVFLPNSNGNFNHFFRIFQHLVRRYPCDMLEFVILRDNAAILFHYMLPYITESPIMDSILGLIFVRDINPETRGQRERCHTRLQELQFLEWIFQAMQMTESSQVENGDILFKSLNRDMIQILVKRIHNSPPSKIRKQMIQIVKLLVKSGMLNTRASSTPVQGPLYFVSVKSQELLAEYLSEFSSLIAKDRGENCDTKQYPLTTSDIDLLEIVYQILYNINEKPQMLASIHVDFWNILVNSFFEKSIFCLILSINDEHTLKAVIEKPYTRGYILLMLNHLRLMADSQQSKFITRTVASHAGLREFLPTLRNDTLTQLQHIYTWKLDACPRPPAHIGPSPPIQVTHFSPYAGTIPLMSNMADSGQDGIDLGSDCDLGFSDAVEREEGFETPGYLSRRNSDQSLSSTQSESGQPTVDIVFEKEEKEENSDEEELECPLCMEELDIADRNFRPCPCGYKICRFCWHHIRENLNGRCPACRREYSEQIAEFEPISADEIQRIRREKKEKERQQKDMEVANRRHLANMRVVQKNLVYIIGLHPKLATEEIIRSNDYFGQFGKIAKIVINKRQIAPTSHANGATSMQPSAAVYVTYVRKEDAAKAIHAVDGSVMAGRILRASYGTTKYCTYYLRNMTCPNPNCLYLHEPGEDADTISKEELATGKHRMRDQMSYDNNNNDDHDHDDEDGHRSSQYSSPSISSSDFPPVSSTVKRATTSTTVAGDEERSALPATASWGKTSTPGTPTIKSSGLPDRTLTPDAFGPPLSVAVAQQQQQQQKQQVSPTVLKRKLEKKKRKELLQKQRKEEEEKEQQQQQQQQQQQSQSSSSSSEDQEQQVQEEEDKSYYPFDGLVQFVLGHAFEEVCLPKLTKEDEEEPVGVSGLHESSSDDDNSNNTPTTPPLSLEQLTISEDMSPLEFFTQSIPTPKYTGTFNPFSHQILRSNTAIFDSPVRKHSRFGFAQF
ncbi:hypothetical protein BCV71DRAFT_241504 [Rhizopus microsporus]|uniref:RING-type domain-containing protein n=1 Tax=Rhizopus microsporus TaxID=58291 RepID=A0A1X0SBE1_RHIZD|nr:hypothetical protein BCV71DRAFT_241504 [Rhizopus microsporus]